MNILPVSSGLNVEAKCSSSHNVTTQRTSTAVMTSHPIHDDSEPGAPKSWHTLHNSLISFCRSRLLRSVEQTHSFPLHVHLRQRARHQNHVSSSPRGSGTNIPSIPTSPSVSASFWFMLHKNKGSVSMLHLHSDNYSDP